MKSAYLLMLSFAFSHYSDSRKHETESDFNKTVGAFTSFRRKRAMSMGDFKMLQGNWKFSKEELEEMFEKYYDCIRKKRESEERGTESINAVLALEAQRVELECEICLRPDQDEGNRVHWQRMDMIDASVSHVKLGNRFKLKKDKTLVIKEVDISDAGQYFCVRGSDVENIVQLDILMKEPQRVIKERHGKHLQLTPAFKLVDHNLEVSPVIKSRAIKKKKKKKKRNNSNNNNNNNNNKTNVSSDHMQTVKRSKRHACNIGVALITHIMHVRSLRRKQIY